MMRAGSLLVVLGLVATGCKKAGAPEAVVSPEEAAKVVAQANTAGDVPTRLARAAALLGDGGQANALEARAILTTVTEDAPDEVRGWVDLGVAHQRLGAWQDAADAFRRATRVSPTTWQAWQGLGASTLATGAAKEAVVHFESGIDAAPDAIALHEGRIAALRAAGDASGAVDAAKDALQVNSRSLVVYNLMGLAYQDLGEFSLARFVYEKAETVPGADEDAAIQANFGWTLYRMGERYPAKVRIERAVALDDAFVPGLAYMARLHLEDRNYEAMVPLLEKARDLAGDNHGVWMNLGIAYRGVGRLDDAQQAWERALQLAPSDPSPHFNLGILLGDDRKDYDAAIARFQAYVDGGGDASDRARDYIEDVERERKKAERQRAKEAARAKKAEERKAREKLLEEAKKKEAASSPWTSEDGPSTDAPAPESAPEPQPEPEAPAPSPWDTEGGDTP